MVKCLKHQKSEFCLKQGRKISHFCLKRGQGMMGRAAPPHARIYRVPPPPPGTKRLESERAKVIFFYISVKLTTMVGA